MSGKLAISNTRKSMGELKTTVVILLALLLFSGPANASGVSDAREYTFTGETPSYIGSILVEGEMKDVYTLYDPDSQNISYLVLRQDGNRETKGDYVSTAVFFASTAQFINKNSNSLMSTFDRIDKDLEVAESKDRTWVDDLLAGIAKKVNSFSLNLCVPVACVEAPLPTIGSLDELQKQISAVKEIVRNTDPKNVQSTNKLSLFYKMALDLQDELSKSKNADLRVDGIQLRNHGVDAKKLEFEIAVKQAPGEIELRVEKRRVEAQKVSNEKEGRLRLVKPLVVECIANLCPNSESYKARFNMLKTNLHPIQDERFNSYISSTANGDLAGLEREVEANKAIRTGSFLQRLSAGLRSFWWSLWN